MIFNLQGYFYCIYALITIARMGSGHISINVCEGGGEHCNVRDKVLKEVYKIGDNNFYYFSTEQVNWFKAQNLCRKHGAYLASFETENEYTYLANYLNSNKIALWIAYNNFGGKDYYSAATGRSGYMKWNKNQPNNQSDTENCVHLGPCRAMTTNNCYKEYNYICRFPSPKVLSFEIW